MFFLMWEEAGIHEENLYAEEKHTNIQTCNRNTPAQDLNLMLPPAALSRTESFKTLLYWPLEPFYPTVLIDSVVL